MYYRRAVKLRTASLFVLQRDFWGKKPERGVAGKDKAPFFRV
jgi:hypothetical protein